jgi:hypothetical protein
MSCKSFDVFWYGVIQRGRSPFVRIALPSSLIVVARGGTVRWNRHITPDLCLATSQCRFLLLSNIIIYLV